VARIHSHFFTESGQFGPRNHEGEQVDEGPLRVVDDNTAVIGDPGVTFDYGITNGDTLMLDPLLPDCDRRAAPDRRDATASWPRPPA
jgi:hypothetical protein